VQGLLPRVIPDEAESGGGLLALPLSSDDYQRAGLGGILFDTGGPIATFVSGGVMFFTTALFVLVFIRCQQASPQS